MPTWGGSAKWEDSVQRWVLISGAKLHNVPLTSPAYSEWSTAWDKTTAPDPYTHWGRTPTYDASTLGSGGDPFGGSYPWGFTTARDPYDSTQEPDLYGTSYLAQFESVDPSGPYTLTGVVYKGFRSDLKHQYASSPPVNAGPLYMLTIGRAYQAGDRGMVIKYSDSGSVFGPWTEHMVYGFTSNGHGADPAAWDCDVKDPSFVIHENGTTVIAYRGVRCDAATSHDHTESVGLLWAPKWNGTYTRVHTHYPHHYSLTVHSLSGR